MFFVGIDESAERLLAAGQTIRQMPVAETVSRYAVRLVFRTHPEYVDAPPYVRRYVRAGASPRAAQSMLAMAKFFAVLDGRMNVSADDVRRAAYPCLRHRILLNFDAIADEATTDTLIKQLLDDLASPKNPKKKKKK